METHVSSNVAVTVICCVLVLSVCTTTAQEVEPWSSIQILDTGPVVNVVCKATFPAGQSGYTIIWSADGNELFVNGLERQYASPRYSISYMQQPQNSSLRIYTSAFTINNALKQDEGAYECFAQYLQDNTMKSAMQTIYVTIQKYLPAENDLKCNLNPSNGDFSKFVTFTCIVGESNPYVTLRLTINSADGSELQIGNVSYSGNASATVAAPVSGSLGTFICTMTSSLFTTANRKCSVKFSPEEMPSTNTIPILPTKNQSTIPGLITLLPEEHSSSNSAVSPTFVPTEHPKYETTLPPETQTAKLGASTNAKSLLFPSIIGGAAAGLLIVLIAFLIVCIVIRKKSCITKNSNPANRPSNTHLFDSINLSHITTDVNGYEPPPPQPLAKQESGSYDYADVPRIEIPPSSKPKTMDKINDTDGYGSPPQGSGTYDYAYADVNKVGTSIIKKKRSTASYDYPDAPPAKSGNYPNPTPDKPGKASNFPIYSQVNKSFKSDKTQNKDDNEQDSIMVDNIVYVSAGPK